MYLQAEKLDPENSKVLFRKAQSLIGLGQVNKGKQLLESLQKIKPDLAIVNALNQLQLNEKSGERKVSQTFSKFPVLYLYFFRKFKVICI